MEAMVHRSYYKRNKNDTRFIIYSLGPKLQSDRKKTHPITIEHVESKKAEKLQTESGR